MPNNVCAKVVEFLGKKAEKSATTIYKAKALITRWDLSTTILFKLADLYLTAFKFAQ